MEDELSPLSPEAMTVLRTIVAAQPEIIDTANKLKQPVEDMVDSTVRMIQRGFLDLVVQENGTFRLCPGPQAGKMASEYKPKRRLFRP